MKKIKQLQSLVRHLDSKLSIGSIRVLLVLILVSFDHTYASMSEAEKALSQIESQRTKVLTEEFVIEQFRKNSVGQKLENANLAQAQLNESLTNEVYQARLYSNYNFQKSQERALNEFQPILSPYEDWTVGVEKNIPLGLKLGVEAFGTQYSFQDKSVTDATQVGGRIKGQFDLWKNLFGMLDRSQLTSQRVQKMRAELQYKVGIKKQELELRKAYWSFISNAQSIELSEELIKSAEKQLQDAKNRLKEGATDRGEVARYQSQVESRKASSLLFKYQREVIMQNFERQFVDFRSTQWAFDRNVDAKKQPVIQQCIQDISSQKDINLSYTTFDEMIGLLKKETEEEMDIAKKHADIDLALIGQYQTTGNSTDYDEARKQLESENKGGYAVGVQLNVPLGTSKSDSEEYLLKLKKNSLEAQSLSMMNDLRSTHETMMKAVALLNLGLKSQIDNSKNLEVNYKEMQRKYRQGRIPVSTLILEQDALFQSRLSEIDIKKQIAHVMLDYFMVFNQFPCSWNQI